MLLAVFNEFAHPEVLEEVKKLGICEVDIAPNPATMATSEEEKQVVRTNAKLITVDHNVTGMRNAFDAMTEESYKELCKSVDEVVKKLEALGFKVENRQPQTSTGVAMLDRVILSYPE